MNDTSDPDPEVDARARPPRRYSATFKAEFLAEYETLDREATESALRREGLYSALISEWRKQRDRGGVGRARPGVGTSAAQSAGAEKPAPGSVLPDSAPVRDRAD